MVCLVFSVRAQLPPMALSSGDYRRKSAPFRDLLWVCRNVKLLAYLLDADLNTSGFGGFLRCASAAPAVGDRRRGVTLPPLWPVSASATTRQVEFRDRQFLQPASC